MTGQPFTLLVDIPLKTGRADEFMALSTMFSKR